MSNFGSQNGSQGAFLEALGASWGALGALLARGPKKDRKLTPKMTDLGSQNGAKIDPKSHQILIIFLIDFWMRFGCLLELDLEALGHHFGAKVASKTVFVIL